MARPVTKRETYEKDAQVILRILQAVMQDERYSATWKKEAEASLRSSASLLLNPVEAKAKKVA